VHKKKGSRPKKFKHTQGSLYTYRLKQLAGNLSQLIRLIAVKSGGGDRTRLYLDKLWEIKCCMCVFVNMHQNQYPHPNTEQWGLLIQVNFGSYNMLLIYQS
jgi:hypothetical protein